jgi:hypothetical protein
MTRGQTILRETGVSIGINAALSIAFFVGLFGLSSPVDIIAFGRDFLPQAFMVTFMGCLVPALLIRRGSSLPAAPVIVRALLMAVAATLIAGAGAWLVCTRLAPLALDLMPALILKTLFGAALAALVTPIAVAAALPSRSNSK